MMAWLHAVLAALLAVQAPSPAPLIQESALARVSDHVHVISDRDVGLVPNVGVIVGSKATLVVDTGLGPRNGETVVRAAGRVSTNAELFVVSTHFHPEHALGESAFPASAKVQAKYPDWAAPARIGPVARTAFTETP